MTSTAKTGELSALAKQLGIAYHTLYRRKKSGTQIDAPVRPTIKRGLSELSKQTGIKYITLYMRLRRGRPLLAPVRNTQPVRTQRRIDRALRAHGIRSVHELVYWFGDENDAAIVSCLQGPWQVICPHQPILMGRCHSKEEGIAHVERWLGEKQWLTVPIHNGIVTRPVMKRALKAMRLWTLKKIRSITDGQRQPLGLRSYSASRFEDPLSTEMMLSDFQLRSAKRDLLPGPWFKSIGAAPPWILGQGLESLPLDEVVAKGNLQYLFSEQRERRKVVPHPFGELVSVDPEAEMAYAAIGDDIYLVRIDKPFGEFAKLCTVFPPDAKLSPYERRVNNKLIFPNRADALKEFAARQRRVARKYLERVEYYVQRAEKAEELASGLDDDQQAGRTSALGKS